MKIKLLSLFLLLAVNSYGQIPADHIWSTSTSPFTCNAIHASAIYYNTTDTRYYICDGTAWRKIVFAKTSISGSSANDVFLSVSGTFPSSLSAKTTGASIGFTGASTDAQTQVAMSIGGAFAGSSVDTTYTGFIGNIGATVSSSAAATGTTIGLTGYADNAGGGRMIGLFGSVRDADPTFGKTGLAMGVVGTVNANANTGSFGGFFLGGGGTFAPPTMPISAILGAYTGSSSISPIVAYAGSVTPLVIFMVGNSGNIYLGNKAGVASPVSRNIYGEPGLGTDISGGNVIIHAGVGTGAATASSMMLKTPQKGSTGSSAQTEISSFDYSQKIYTAPDATDVSLFTVDLPTSFTGCSIKFTVSYTVTDGSANITTHTGIQLGALINSGGTVSGSIDDAGEVVEGTNCPIACDTYPISVSGTVATIKANFNNTLGVDGAIRYNLLSNTCQSYTRQ